MNDAVHLVYGRRLMSLMKPACVWLGFRGPDCNVTAEQGGGPDARPSWAGSGWLPAHGLQDNFYGGSATKRIVIKEP